MCPQSLACRPRPSLGRPRTCTLSVLPHGEMFHVKQQACIRVASECQSIWLPAEVRVDKAKAGVPSIAQRWTPATPPSLLAECADARCTVTKLVTTSRPVGTLAYGQLPLTHPELLAETCSAPRELTRHWHGCPSLATIAQGQQVVLRRHWPIARVAGEAKRASAASSGPRAPEAWHASGDPHSVAVALARLPRRLTGRCFT